MQALPCHIRADVLSDAGGHGFAGHRLGGSWHGDREEKREMRLKASVGGEHPSHQTSMRGIPTFMKEDLVPIMGEDRMIQQLPKAFAM